jgi:hypothetical protein
MRDDAMAARIGRHPDPKELVERLKAQRPPRLRSSFDHLVGAGEQRRRYFEAERLSRLEIDGELETR